MNITYGLAQARFNSDRAIKLEYIYVSWDMTYAFEVEIYFWPVPPLVTVCHFQTKETLRSRLTFLLLLPLTFFCRSPFFSFLLFQALNLFLWYRNTDQVTLWKRSRVVCRLLQKCLPIFFIAAGFGSDAYRYIIIFL